MADTSLMAGADSPAAQRTLGPGEILGDVEAVGEGSETVNKMTAIAKDVVEMIKLAHEDLDVAVNKCGGKGANLFSDLAKKFRKKAAWYYVKADDAKVVIKHLGEPALESTETDYETFFTENKFPFYGGLDGDTDSAGLKA